MKKYFLLSRQALLIALLIAILGLAFLAYLQPSFILDLANRYILC
jgi:hypothetical protein